MEDYICAIFYLVTLTIWKRQFHGLLGLHFLLQTSHLLFSFNQSTSYFLFSCHELCMVVAHWQNDNDWLITCFDCLNILDTVLHIGSKILCFLLVIFDSFAWHLKFCQSSYLMPLHSQFTFLMWFLEWYIFLVTLTWIIFSPNLHVHSTARDLC